MLAFSSFCPFNMNLRINIYVFLFDTAHLTTCTHTLTFHTFLMNKCAFNLSLFFLIKIRNCLFAYVFPSQLPFLKILNTLNRKRNRNQTYKCSSHFIRSQCTHVQNSRLIWRVCTITIYSLSTRVIFSSYFFLMFKKQSVWLICWKTFDSFHSSTKMHRN